MKLKRLIVLLAVVATIATACGSDSNSSSSPDTSAKAAGGKSGDCKLDKPLKVVGLAETTGEGPQAVPYYANGWELGVEAVNDAGGICGQDVVFERIPTSPTDTAAAKNSFLSAIDKKADVLVGLAGSADVIALAPDVVRAATPAIWFASPPNAFLGADGSVGSKWAFLIRPRTTGGAAAQVDYLVNTLGKKKIGLICVNQTFGQQGCDATKAAIAKTDAKIVDTETHEVTDTNLTSKVLALKNAGVDGIVAYTYPNTGVVMANQLADNGLNVPVMTGAIADLAIATGNVKPDAVKNLIGYDDCAPAVEPQAKEFAAAYTAKFNSKPNYSAAQSYDSLFIIKQAVEAAGSADKAAVAEALKNIDYQGACTHYKSDSGNGLAQSAVIETFDAEGVPTVVKKVTLAG